jgi:hypothetical protein
MVTDASAMFVESTTCAEIDIQRIPETGDCLRNGKNLGKMQ